MRRNSLYCERKIVSVLPAWRFEAMAFVPPSLLEQRKETAEALARKQRMAAILRRIKQLYAPLRPVAQSRSWWCPMRVCYVLEQDLSAFVAVALGSACLFPYLFLYQALSVS
jgi:hypothetical protein